MLKAPMHSAVAAAAIAKQAKVTRNRHDAVEAKVDNAAAVEAAVKVAAVDKVVVAGCFACWTSTVTVSFPPRRSTVR